MQNMLNWEKKTVALGKLTMISASFGVHNTSS